MQAFKSLYKKKVVTTTTMIYGLNFVLDDDMHIDMVVMNEMGNFVTYGKEELGFAP